ncbi:DUF885 family protein [Arcanobacterium hippocoleae]
MNTNPELVTAIGLPGASESDFADNSPAGLAAQAELKRECLRNLYTILPQDDIDIVTANSLRQTLSTELELYDLGEFGDLNNIATPLQSTAEIFDNMPQTAKEDWELICTRLERVAPALQGWEETLSLRAAKGAPSQSGK